MVELSSSSSEEEEEDSEEEDGKESTSRRSKKSTPSSPVAKRRKITIRQPSREKAPARKRTTTTASNAAWESLFERVLGKDETPETSLLAALRQVGNTTSKRRGAANKMLVELTRSLIRDHFEDANAVHVRLYNLVFRMCGGTGEATLPLTVDLENLSDDDLTEYISGVVQSMESTAATDVLWTVAPPAGGAKLQFRTLCQEFWHGLGVAALESTVTATSSSEKKKKKKGEENSDIDEDDSDKEYDERGAQSSPRFQVEVVRSIVTRLVEMAFLQQEDLRSAFVMALYSLATALLHKTVQLREKLETAERQFHAAKRHKQRRKSEALKIQVDTGKRMIQDLEDIVKESVIAIFMKRYKDVNPHIRASSMLALADFSVIRPDIFFDKKYLKYPGWTLNDKEAVVRTAALKAFLRPCQSGSYDENVMDGVAEKFATRFADCTLDVDTSVQESALELLLFLARAGLLDSIQDEETWNQINLRALDTETTQTVRKLALEFIIEQIGAFDDDVADTDANAVERLNQMAGWVCHTLGAGDIPLDSMRFELSAYIVQSMSECPQHSSLVRNFPAMVKALEDSLVVTVTRKGQRDRILADAKQRVLLEFLMSAVEEEVQLSEPEHIMDIDLKEPEKKGNKVSVQEEMTRALLPSLPKLVKSFKTETVLLRRLVKLPLYFSATACSLSDQKRNYKKLLSSWEECFMELSDKEVFQNCCHALSFLATADHARHDEALTVLHDIFGSLRKRLDDLIAKKGQLDNESVESDGENDEESSAEKIDNSINLTLQRLAVLSKRWPLFDLLEEGEEEAGEESVDKLCDTIFQLATHELDVRKPFIEDEKLEIPHLWNKPSKAHKSAAEIVDSALAILLSTTGWTVHKKVAGLGPSSEKRDEDAREEPNVMLVMRKRAETILSLSFEQYLDDENVVSEEHRDFSETVQEVAGRAAADLRTLFPREWQNSVHFILREVALVDDSHLIGGYARYLKAQEKRLRETEGKEDANPWIARNLLLPITRALCANWASGNRREAGLVLAHITQSGSESAAIVAAMSKTLKKINPVRLLEAHMACLREEFEAWADSEPTEPESENPTEEENAAFEEAEKQHEEAFQALEIQTHRLSNSLGVGKIKDSSLANGVLGFIREGIRFAFSRNEVGSDEPLFLGARLPFLRLLSKYLVWVRKNKRQIDIIRAQFNQKEDEVRSDHDFDQVLESDIEAMDLFRKVGNLGPFVMEDDTTVGGRSYASRSVAASSRASSSAMHRRRHSVGSSVGSVSKGSTQRSDLSPLPEEQDGETEDDAKTDAASPGNSTLASSRIFSPASKNDDMTAGSHEDENSI
eukprot:scaffold4097_cov166-Amphora_coffeaeformis.AAC.15